VQAALDTLAAVPGMNVARGLAVMLGRGDRFLGLFKRFVQAQPAQLQLLATRLEQGEHEAARHVVHSLKGAASSLGAEQLADAAGRIEARLRGQGQNGRPGVVAGSEVLALNRHVRALQAALAHWPSEDMAPDSNAADAAAALAALPALGAHLTLCDTAALQVVEDHLAGLRQLFGADADHLLRALRAFDFDAAQQTLHHMRRPA
jgi:HPt (histidine-containing phosphotransfer) domain-containing protein